MTGYEECLRKRLLRPERPDKGKAQDALKMAHERFIDAKISKDAEIPAATILLVYAALFHASRALLFKDGYSEKSHYCVVEYIREKYVKTGKISSKFIPLLHEAREERHEVLYALEKKETKKDAEFILTSAREFIRTVEKLIKEEKP
jgi:uncharacterized protein (UPF0332 family)